MVSTIAGTYVLVDMMKSEADALTKPEKLRAWLVGSMVSKWVVDQTVKTGMTLNIGHKSLQFTKLPDGSYQAPPGITSQLSQIQNNPSCGHMLKERMGNKLCFDASSNRITRWENEDVPSVDMDFSYTTINGKPYLQTVTDIYGRQLVLVYSDQRLTIVQEKSSAGSGVSRAVSYGNTTGNLETYVDPRGKTWTYTYYPDHRIWQVKDPLQNTTTNTYENGKVKIQKSPNQYDYLYTFSGYVENLPAICRIDTNPVSTGGYYSTEEDPNSERVTKYCFDGNGRLITHIDAKGQKTVNAYDDRNNIISTTDIRGYTTNYNYDPVSNNLLTATKNGIVIENNTYYSTYPYLLRNKQSIGAPATTFTYHDRCTHRIKSIAVSGISSQYEYNTYCRISTFTDANSLITTYTNYDSFGNPQTITTDNQVIGKTYTYRDELWSASVGNPAQFTISYSYYPDGLPYTISYPNTSYQYYDNGYLQSRTMGGNIIPYDYTPSGKLKTVNNCQRRRENAPIMAV